MRHLIDVDFADQVFGTHQLHFLIPGQVTGIEEAKSAEFQQQHHAIGVVRSVPILRAMRPADLRVGLVRVRGVDECLAGSQAAKHDLAAIDLFEFQHVAGVDHASPC